MLLSQRIRIQYGHASVGGAGAQRRGQLPLGAPLHAASPSAACIEQDLFATEPDFPLEVLRTKEHACLPKELAEFALDGKKVFFRANSVWKGLQSDLQLDLEEERWVRLRFNRRTRDPHLFVNEYEDFILNVALVTSDFASSFFVTSVPSREYDFRRELR